MSENIVCGVYGIFDEENNQCLYVGQSVDIYRRWESHKNAIKNSYHTQKGLVKYVNERQRKIKYVILCTCKEEDLYKLEKQYFDKLSPKFFGQIPQGNKRTKPTKETRDKISKAMSIFNQNNPEYSIWNRTVEKYGYEKAREISISASFASNKELAKEAGRKGGKKPKSREHKMKISRSITELHSKNAPSKGQLESKIKEGQVNYSKLVEEFNISRQTIKKYLKKYGLFELFESNYSNEYVKIECKVCGRMISKNAMKRHLSSKKCRMSKLNI